MYAGRKVEEASVETIFERPMHPYTQGLLGAVPKLGSSLLVDRRTKLTEIRGRVPSLQEKIVACAFADRCPIATQLCREIPPAVAQKQDGHFVACHYAQATPS